MTTLSDMLLIFQKALEELCQKKLNCEWKDEKTTLNEEEATNWYILLVGLGVNYLSKTEPKFEMLRFSVLPPVVKSALNERKNFLARLICEKQRRDRLIQLLSKTLWGNKIS